jgi:hypothetical protein
MDFTLCNCPSVCYRNLTFASFADSSFNCRQSRHPPIHPPAITLSHFPSPHSSPSVPTISHALALIFPLLATIPVSLHTLNETYFFPRSDNEDLHSGWLQLPRATLCVIVETGISEGEINGKGATRIQTTTVTYSRFWLNQLS